MDTSYLEKQVSTIINKLHELFDEIGVPSHERDSRESELFAALSDTLHSQLRIVTNEKSILTEEAEKLITTIKQMHSSLEGNGSNYELDHELQITYPLKSCLQVLKEKHISISKVHQERYDQVKKLALAIESYSSHLEPTFAKVQLPPLTPNATISPSFDLSHTYFSALDDEFTRVYDEYQKRINTVSTLSSEIITLWAELGTPQAQTDSNIVELGRDSPEQLGLHAEDISRLKARRDKLVEEKKGRERRLRDVRAQIEQLWERLCIPEDEQKQFIAQNRGCGMRAINEFEDELGRLNELKKQNLGLFVEEARIRIQGLWDGLYFSEEEMLDFTPAFSDVYSDALLSAHEAEIARLEALKEQRAPILNLVDRHKALIQEREDLQASSQDASRLMLRGQKGEKRDPGKLLREEKMRKRISKELPKLEADLRKILESWEDEYGRPFLVFGDRYLDEIESLAAKAAPPPRSKTPSNMNHGRTTSKSSAPPSRTGTVKAPPASGMRSKTPTNFNTMRNNPVSQAISHKPSTSKGNISPSRIPGRAPLSSTHGNNSPERKYMTIANHKVEDASKTIKNMGPPRLPPPKMKDLFIPPQSHTPNLLSRSTADLEHSASIVRQIAPDDPYDDPVQHSAFSKSAYYYSSSNGRSAASVASSSSSVENHPPSHSLQQGMYHNERYYSHAPPPPSRPESRQISAQSNASSQATSGVSGSENWETLDEGGSEAEMDATEAYYARLRAQQQQHHQNTKRPSPEVGWTEAPGKRVRPAHMQVGAVRGVNAGEWEEEDVY